jgi:hypothetical protein
MKQMLAVFVIGVYFGWAIASLIWLRQLHKARMALLRLYFHDADYIRVNHLGDLNHNQVMRDAADILKLR